MPYIFNGTEVVSTLGLHGGVVDDLSALAAAAISAYITGLDMLQGSDSRLPKKVDIEGDWEDVGKGPLGEFWWGRRTDGTLVVPGLSVGEGVMRVVDIEDVLWSAGTFTDPETGVIRFSEGTIGLNGEWPEWVCRRIVARGGGAASGGGTVHVLIGMGQSNMSGRGQPFSPEIDPPDPRIFQYGAHATDITQATVPLDMVDAATGVSPLTLIAREYVKRLPPGDVVLLIPAARGGSTLGDASTTSTTGVWNVAYAGASTDLYALAKAQIDAALDALAEKWPGAPKRLVGMFWHQGEGNPDTSQTDYASRWDAIVADLRTRLSDPDMPAVLGGMVPEWVASHANLAGVQAAHVDTPNRNIRTGYAYAPANSGGNANLDPDNQIHMHREGLEKLSHRMLEACDRALRNVTTSVPNVPQNIWATLNGTTLTMNWSQPMCRYTAFAPEYSANGGAWTAIPLTTVDNTAVATITGTNPVRVRLSVTNEYGTSVTSTPVYATIIKEP